MAGVPEAEHSLLLTARCLLRALESQGVGGLARPADAGRAWEQQDQDGLASNLWAMLGLRRTPLVVMVWATDLRGPDDLAGFGRLRSPMAGAVHI